MIDIVEKNKDIITDEMQGRRWMTVSSSQELKKITRGRCMTIGVGILGAGFTKNIISIDCATENSSVFITNDGGLLAMSKAKYKYLYKGDEMVLRQRIRCLCNEINPQTVFVVGELGHKDTDILLLVSSIISSFGIDTVVAGFSPFDFESEEVKKRAIEAEECLLTKSICTDFLIVRMNDILSFVSKKALMPRVYLMGYEIVKGYIDQLSV